MKEKLITLYGENYRKIITDALAALDTNAEENVNIDRAKYIHDIILHKKHWRHS